MFTQDYVMNGVGHGEVGSDMERIGWDPGLKRPFVDSQGNRCVVLNTHLGRPKKVLISTLMQRGIWDPTLNAASLRKEDWIYLDTTVQKAFRQRLKAWKDLASRSRLGGFNAMAKMTYEYEAMSDPGQAVTDMDGLTEGRQDSPLFNLRSIPLPITHSDFSYSQRRLEVSYNSNTPLDTVSAEAAGRRIGELVEKTLLGIEPGITYGTQTTGATAHTGTSTIWGYTTFPYRLTKADLTVPTGANPNATIDDILAMRNSMLANRFYGPFMLYHSTDWDNFLDNDYAFTNSTGWAVNPSMTLRDRIKKIPDIIDCQRLDFLTEDTNPYTLIMVQMTSDVVQAIDGMGIQVLQWESKGGLKRHFKAMCIQVPLFRFDYYGRCGVLHATTS